MKKLITKPKIILFIILTPGLLAILFNACDKKSSTGRESGNEFDLVTAVDDNYLTTFRTESDVKVNIGIDALFDWLIMDGNTANDPYIMGYRSAADYTAGHIKGAVNSVPANLMEKIANETIPKYIKIVSGCYTGQTSAQVVAYLRVLGYDAVRLLYGHNGFAYNTLTKSKYVAPTKDYSALIVK